MPVQFLSDEQARRYGSFHRDPSPKQLSRSFSFGPAEHDDIVRHRTDRARLGYAVQLGCVRFLGCFPDLGAVPATVVPPSWSTWPRPGSSTTRSYCPASRR